MKVRQMAKQITSEPLVSYGRNLAIFYPIFILGRSVAMVIPAYIPLMNQHGFSDGAVFYFEAFFIVVLALLQAPTGYLADNLGRKKCLLVGAAAWILALSMYQFVDGWFGFLVIQGFFALGSASVAGADIALLKASLSHCRQEHLYSKLIARLLGVAQFCQIGFFLVGGILAQVDLKLPFAVASFGYLLYLMLASQLHEEANRVVRKQVKLEELQQILWWCLKEQKKLAWMILAQALFLGSTYIGFWYSIPIFRAVGIGQEYYGYLLGSLALCAAIANFSAHQLDKLSSKQSWQLLFCLFFLGLLLPCFGSITLIIAGLAIQKLLLGLALVVFNHRISKLAQQDQEASVLSVGGMVLNASQLVLLLVNGPMLDQFNNPVHAYSICACVLAVLGILLYRKAGEY